MIDIVAESRESQRSEAGPVGDIFITFSDGFSPSATGIKHGLLLTHPANTKWRGRGPFDICLKPYII